MALMTMMTVALVMALAAPVLAEEEAAAPVKSMGKVNINTASIEQLMSMDGIGEAYAKRIVSYREKNGPFQTPEDLMKVKGIGQKTFDANKDRIVVKGSKQ